MNPNELNLLSQQQAFGSIDHLAFMDLLFKPLTHKITGEPWPAGGTNTASREYLPVWLNLTQKRYEFKRGNHYVATEIKALCDTLQLYAPVEVLEWLAENPERVVSKSEKRSRKKELVKRNMRAEYNKLIAVFEIEPAKAIGWIQQKMETDGVFNEHGKPFSSETIKSYIEHDPDDIETKSFVLAASKTATELTTDQRKQWQKNIIERYPDEIKFEWSRSCTN